MVKKKKKSDSSIDLKENLLKALNGSRLHALQLAATLGVSYSKIKSCLDITNIKVNLEAKKLHLSREEVLKKCLDQFTL